ncbi:MAG: type II secretion system major pseudopilin GspG [Planctomycetota bacterium]|jgi:general secretion pathway protein G
MRRRKNAGFTLVELILVLIILSLLAAIVVPKIVGRGREARINAAKGQVGMFKDALNQYALDNYDQFPSTEQGLDALVARPSSNPVPKKWKGPYLDGLVPMDPWGNEYKYLFPSKHLPKGFDVWSMGPDGQDGTDDDIGTWNLQQEFE